ncbi:MAG: hypothetical protein UT63_C0019G0011 [Candidatus Gottesmanbacteria bacterium GW2011_GWC2_39_8]|uniref:SpoVT-AbrB domain-containing protein n=1 Tax=Candidatus Gottesmanbacteria bacterium GW2011_GWC2_39_8 TaxID=1618450 RepID=A0A0G0PYR5_9BACT|nr:MAG: hypothetical protein UT63_C0019G0011 [Candidatus Gottesmanbacteria bacterium GW2011_GWC2_39_8]
MVQIQSAGDNEITLISSRNQTVVPAKIRRKLGLKSGDQLIWRIVKIGDQYKILAEPAPKSWADYTLGLGKNTWKNVNLEEYIENLRNEWQK